MPFARRIVPYLAVIAASAGTAAPASAADPVPACAAVAPPPAALAGWSQPVPRTAGSDAATAPAVALGQAVTLALRPDTAVAYPVAPRRTAAGTHGGLVTLTVVRAGTYRIALDGPGWIEVASAGSGTGSDSALATGIASSAHAHGPACSGIRKMVDFALVPGAYLVAVAGSPTPGVRLMVAPLEP